MVVRQCPATEEQISDERTKDIPIINGDGQDGNHDNHAHEDTNSIVSTSRFSEIISDTDSETASSVRINNNTFKTVSCEDESVPVEDSPPPHPEMTNQRVAGEEIQSQVPETGLLDGKEPSQPGLSSEEKEICDHEHSSLPTTYMPVADETATGTADKVHASSVCSPFIAFIQSVERVDASKGNGSAELVEEVKQGLKELHQGLITEIREELKEPIINEIKQVTVLVISAVSGSDDVV